MEFRLRSVRRGTILWRYHAGSNFPITLSLPVEDMARKIYLLISGVTFPMQSQIANLHVVVNYTDGGKSEVDLANPENFDTGWVGFYGGNYHYAANGMEVIGSGPPEEKDILYPETCPSFAPEPSLASKECQNCLITRNGPPLRMLISSMWIATPPARFKTSK